MAFDPSMLILVVADHDTAVRIVHTLLRQLGCANVDDANNVAEALTKMRIKRYGLVISDWDTEPMTGCDFLRGVRCDPGLNRTPFIMTGESKSENVIAAKRKCSRSRSRRRWQQRRRPPSGAAPRSS
jgi:two-component system chemotaxis response regulator CheY